MNNTQLLDKPYQNADNALLDAQKQANELKEAYHIIYIHGVGYKVVCKDFELNRKYYHGDGGGKMFFDFITTVTPLYFTLTDCLGNNEIKVYGEQEKLFIQFNNEMDDLNDATLNNDFYEWCIKKCKHEFVFSKPLYKVLDEKRTQGEYSVEQGHEMNEYLVKIPQMDIATYLAIDIDDEEGLANAKYTALAVNNLASIADTLNEIFLHGKIKDGRFEFITSEARINEMKEALSKIR